MENANDTFKGLKKNSRFGQMAPIFGAVNIQDANNADKESNLEN
jgi:hypothetical protein